MPTAITYISFFGPIQDTTVRPLMSVCADALVQTKPSQLYILFSSSGGSVEAGIALYNYIRALPVPVVMHNTGSIDSIANVVFLAADERYANPHSTFLLHGLHWNFNQGAQLSWSQLQETVSRFRADEARMVSIITQRTSIKQEAMTQLLHQGESKDPEFALEHGWIREIKEAKVTSGAPLFSLNF